MISDVVSRALTLAPDAGPTICSTCRGLLYTGGEVCAECLAISALLGRALIPVSAMTMYSKPSQWRDWLTYYKPGEHGEAMPDARQALKELVADFLGRFVLANPTLNQIVVVPSTSRPAPHPLEAILRDAKLAIPVVTGPQRTTRAIGHNQPDAAAYDAGQRRWDGIRVLLVDDVYTTGAHAQSVAACLEDAGAQVGALAVIARRLNPDYSTAAASLWKTLNEGTYEVELALARAPKAFSSRGHEPRPQV